jgi:hypothetical protein
MRSRTARRDHGSHDHQLRQTQHHPRDWAESTAGNHIANNDLGVFVLQGDNSSECVTPAPTWESPPPRRHRKKERSVGRRPAWRPRSRLTGGRAPRAAWRLQGAAQRLLSSVPLNERSRVAPRMRNCPTHLPGLAAPTVAPAAPTAQPLRPPASRRSSYRRTTACRRSPTGDAGHRTRKGILSNSCTLEPMRRFSGRCFQVFGHSPRACISRRHLTL